MASAGLCAWPLGYFSETAAHAAGCWSLTIGQSPPLVLTVVHLVMRRASRASSVRDKGESSLEVDGAEEVVAMFAGLYRQRVFCYISKNSGDHIFLHMFCR